MTFEELKAIAAEILQEKESPLIDLLNSLDLAAVCIVNIYQMCKFTRPLTQHFNDSVYSPMQYSVTVITHLYMVSIIKIKLGSPDKGFPKRAMHMFHEPIVTFSRTLRENLEFVVGAVDMVLLMM